MKHQLQTIRAALESADEYQAENYHDYEGPRPAIAAALTAFSELERMAGKPVSHATVAGALFDFMGWLTSRRARLVLSSVDNAAPAADAIKEFVAMRGLSINDAQVQTWKEQLAAPPAQQPQEEHLTITWDEQQTRILAVTMQDEEGRILKVLAEAPARQPHERHLLNLLARIHGDGGHYTAEHGLEKSVSDADQKVADLHLKAWEAQQPPEIEVQCPVCSHKFYEWPKAKQTQYEAGDMASAHNDGFRAGVASVAQQPQAEERCQYCDGTGDVHSIDGQWRGECHCQKQPQAEAVPDAMKVVLEAMRSDPDYAWSWHCNVAMAFYDAGGDIYTANQGAARFMRMLADVEPAHELPAAPQQAEAPVAWPTMPPSKGQSPVLFEDGYAEGWAKCLSACKSLFPAQQPQAEVVHHKPVRVCHIKDVACSEAAVKCGECPDAAPQQAEAVPNDVTRDAARYLWLRSKVGVSPEHERAYIWLPCGNSKINPAETDAAIDAAMAQGANHG